MSKLGRPGKKQPEIGCNLEALAEHDRRGHVGCSVQWNDARPFAGHEKSSRSAQTANPMPA